MKIFGYKPSEVRKALASFAAAILILALALPAAGLPASVAVAIAGTVAVTQGAIVFLTRNDVAAVIDSADNLNIG